MPTNLEDIFGGEDNELAKKQEGGLQTAADGHTYHKSTTANATEAPTNQGTHETLKKQLLEEIAGLDDVERDFVMMHRQYHGIYGVPIPSDIAEQRYNLRQELYDDLYGRTHVRDKLQKLGVIRVVSGTIKAPSVLTPHQLRVANAMLDVYDTRSDKKKLQDLNVSTATYNQWLRSKPFQEYLADRAESLLDGAGHEAYLGLVDRVRAGDMKAITLMLELKGKYIDPRNSSSNTQVVSQQDLPYIVARIVEIVVDECDKETAQRIGDRIKMLGSARAVGQTFDTEPIVVPQAVALRDPETIKLELSTNARHGEPE